MNYITVIPESVKKDLLDGEATAYIRDGYLYFDGLLVDQKGVALMHKGREVAKWVKVDYASGETITLNISDGRMRIKIE